MNKKEFFAAVNLYKRQSEIVQWKNDFLPKAIAASAKEILAHSTGNDEDAMAFANELASYTKKLDWIPDSEFAKISSLIEHSAEEMAEKYGATFDDGVLEHGTKWKDHKYIRIENGRYIYPEDLEAKNLRKKAAEQEEVAKDMQRSAKLGEHLLSEGKTSDDKPVSSNKELSNKMQRDIDQSKAWSAGAQSQAKGMLRKADELEKIAEKKRLDDKASDLAKANEERKERAVNNNNQSVQTARSQSDESAAKAQKEGEAMQAWKNAQAVRAKDNGSKNAAQSEGEAYQKWKEQQAENSKNAIKKTAEKITETVKSKEWQEDFQKQTLLNSRKMAQKEGANAKQDSQQWKDWYQKEINSTREEVKKLIDNGSSLEDAVNTVGKNRYNKGGTDTSDPYLTVVSPENYSKNVSDALKNDDYLKEYAYNSKKNVYHSLNLTREEYYAGIEEYKRKKA